MAHQPDRGVPRPQAPRSHLAPWWEPGPEAGPAPTLAERLLRRPDDVTLGSVADK